MTVTVSQHYIATATSAAPLNKTSVVVGSGEGLIVLVHASDADPGASPTITGVTWNTSESLSQHSNGQISDGQGTKHRHAAFFLPNPSAGTHTVSATFGSTPLLCSMEVIVVAGHDTTAPIRAFTSVGGGDSGAGGVNLTPSVTMSGSVSGDTVIDLLRYRSDGATPTGGPDSPQTQLDTVQAAGSSFWYHYSSTKTSASTTPTMSYTFTGSAGGAWNIFAVSLTPAGGGDTTAPTLTSATGSGTGATTASGGVTTDEANGTLYAVCQLNATGAPSAAQIRAGQNGAGAAAPYATSQSISSTGAKTFNATGLTASTSYKWYFTHRDASNNDSSVVSSSSFSTSASGRTATITLTSDGTTPRANLTALKWAWFDQVTPNLFAAPTDQGNAETTDASGVLVLSLPNSALAFGGVGFLIITDSDGTPSQSPAAKAFAGPVSVT